MLTFIIRKEGTSGAGGGRNTPICLRSKVLLASSTDCKIDPSVLPSETCHLTPSCHHTCFGKSHITSHLDYCSTFLPDRLVSFPSSHVFSPGQQPESSVSFLCSKPSQAPNLLKAKVLTMVYKMLVRRSWGPDQAHPSFYFIFNL